MKRLLSSCEGWILLALLGFLPLGPRPAAAAEVAAVVSQDLAPYQEALEGIQESLTQPLTVFNLATEPGGEQAVLDRLREKPPDLVIAVGTRAARLATGALRGVPVLFCMVLGAEAEVLGGPHVTGVLLEVSPKEQIAAFRQVVPTLSRLAVLYDPAKSAALLRRAHQAAEEQGITLQAESVSRPDQVPPAFRRMAAEADGFWIIPDSTVVSRESFEYILLQSVERRIPVMVFSEPMVRAGGLHCLAPENRDLRRQAGELALRVLQGGSGKLPPPERPRHPQLLLNLKTASAIGLEVPESIVRQASHVIR